MDYKFQSHWLEEPCFKAWLQRKKEGGKTAANCKVCNKDLVAHKKVLMRHLSSTQHKKSSSAIRNTAPIADCLKKNTSLEDKMKRAELKVVGMLVVNNFSFLSIDNIVPTLKQAFTDSEILNNLYMHRTKATAIVKNVLGACFSSELNEKLKQNYFSIIIDETTDVSVKKQIAFVVLFYDEASCRVSHSFFDLKECQASNAKDIFLLLKETIIEKGIPFKNLVGFAADTPNVMFGKYNSVSSHLKSEKPSIVLVKCSCHLVHLIASKSALKLPTYLEDLLRNLGAYFNRSYLRQSKLQEFQHYFQIDVHKILSPTITRWLSLNSCVNRVLEQYEVLRSFFRLEVFEDPSKVTESVLTALDKKSTKAYLEFLSYSLNILTTFNLIFQSERPMLYKLKYEVSKILQTFLSNFIKLDILKQNDIWSLDPTNKTYFVEPNEMYIGLNAQNTILLCSQEEQQDIYNNIKTFYIEVAVQIKKKIYFDDPFYEILDIVEPKFAKSFKIKSLLKFKIRFPFVEIDWQKLDNEWREHAFLDHNKFELFDTLDVETYWSKVFQIQNCTGELLFPNLCIVIKLLLILPFSNASVERVFSKLNITKTNLRNSLSSDTIASIMFAKEGIERNEGLNFEPSENMLKMSWKKNQQ